NAIVAGSRGGHGGKLLKFAKGFPLSRDSASCGELEMPGQGSEATLTKQGLQAFRDLEQSELDALPTGFCICRADGALVRYNKRAVELWGRAPQLGDTGEHSEINFRRYTAQGVRLPFAATPVAVALRSGVPVRGVELL